MIKIPSALFRSLISRPLPLSSSNKCFFAKEAKPPKEGKKGGKQQKKQQPPVEQEPTQKLHPYERVVNYFTPLQPGLSPSEQESLETKFSDLSDTDKEILDKLAQKIAELNTSMFYNLVLKRQALGTTEGFIVGSGTWEDAQVTQAIKLLRKDI